MDSNALFGRYYPADSPVHRLDPRTKLIGVLVAFAAVFAAQGPYALAGCALFTAAFYAVARIPLRQAARAVAPLLVLVLLTAVLNALFVQGGSVVAQLGPIRITEEGLASAAFLSCRLVLLVLIACLLTLTTPTFDITEGTERLLGPLRRAGVPVHEMAMMMGLALRFLPVLSAELQTLYRAQASRCADLALNPLRGGLRTMQALAVPLLAASLRHADTLSAAMDARCYHGGTGRTRLRPMAFHGRDAAAAAAVAAMLACALLLNAGTASGIFYA